ncbi:Ran-binding-domain-containing protein [Choiromyces venosus 120613-1]|uniref:Ran-binding-domain-containing protein n=1 Tax=Choiromyces venosus 120613-1 TaxID=1336337 RepID=A0A3N4K6P4_9PEZI|nr:Ran-binding-domain-containing protein [Choiromyces venosus 120613-1]
MEFFLAKVSQQAVSFAIRSGIIVTSQFAIKECGRYISSIKGKDRQELQALQDRLEQKIRIISPAIDLVEIISARGNTSLESALTLTKNIRHNIQSLGVRVASLSAQEGGRKRLKSPDEINAVVQDIKQLLRKIEDAVPFINLAITTSGVNISSNIPHNVSPSRLMQASTLLTAGDTAYSINPFNPAQIGTTFTLSLYMLFAGHSHRQEHVSSKDLTWQEVIYKCKVKLQRVPLVYDDDQDDDGANRNNNQLRAQSKIDEYCYELCLIEDLDDGRMHEVEEGKQPPGSFEDVGKAGLRTRIPIHQISKIFYTNSGQLLGIEDSNSPILLVKRDLNAAPPRKLVDRVEQYDYGSDSEGEYPLDMREEDSREIEPQQELPEEYELPHHLDAEWLAFEVFTEPEPGFDDAASEYSDAEESLSIPGSSPPGSVADPNTSLAQALSNVELNINEHPSSPTPYTSPNVKSTLSILECLLRLTILQNHQQTSHLAVHDELLNLFLSDLAWGGTRESRQQERENARRRIGFDPFGSPTKPEKQAKVGTIQLTGSGGSRVNSRQGSSRGTPQSYGRSYHLDSSLPMTPSSDSKKPLPNLGDREQPVLASNRELWTPEQQLSSMFNSPYGTSPLAKKNPPGGNKFGTEEGG